MTQTSAPAPIFLDTDPGVDDAMALYYLLASPEVELVGIGSVSGNIDAGLAAQNALRLLELAGRSDIPVAQGLTDFQTHPFSGGATHVHGENGLGNIALPEPTASIVEQDAADLLISLAKQYPGELRLLAIGPLTNIAEALRREPNLVNLIDSVTIMGGAAMAPGNVSPAAEANIINDPEAAAEVLAAPWEITLVPLDVTMAHVLEADQLERLSNSVNPLASTLADIIAFYAEFYTMVYGRAATALHDPLAAAIAVGSVEVALAPNVDVVVDTTDGPSRGATVADMRGAYNRFPAQEGAHCNVVLELAEAFAPHMVDRILTLAKR